MSERREKIEIEDLSFLSEQPDLYHINFSFQASNKFKYIYVETPKAGCSSLRYLLIKNEDPGALEFEDRVDADDFLNFLHMREFSPLLSPRQMYPFRTKLESPEFFKFTFVRHPVTRIVSAYLDKLAPGRPLARARREAIGLGNSSDRPGAADFESFLDRLTELDLATADPHWRSQYAQVYAERIPFDLIGKLETFAADVAALCRRTGLDPTHLKKVSPHATRAADARQELIGPAARRKIEQIYRVDFERFNYQADEFS